MKFSRILCTVAIAVLGLGLTAGVVKADGGDPRGAAHTPTKPGNSRSG